MPRILDNDLPDITDDMKAAYYGPDDFDPNSDYPSEPDYYGDPSVMTFPVTHDLTIAGLYWRIGSLHAMRTRIYDDPMSDGAPLEDFAEEWDRKERKLWCDVLSRAHVANDPEAKRLALDALLAWCP